MSKTNNHFACAAFQDRLPDLISTGENINDHLHLQSCPDCRLLLADLETIAEAARRLFPVVEPPDNLWNQIEMAIENEGATYGKHSARS